MLRELSAALQTPAAPGLRTVADLARQLDVTEDQVRLGVWQLERLGRLSLPAQSDACATPPAACGGCPIKGVCAAKDVRTR